MLKLEPMLMAEVPTQDETKPREETDPSGLLMIEPGLYVDGTGHQYFYLTGLWSPMQHSDIWCLFSDCPDFVFSVLDGFRDKLKLKCMELMD